MATNSSSESENLDGLCQRIMQDKGNKFGWEPAWNTLEIRQEIIATAQAQTAPVATALERAAMRYYCASWYAACQSEQPIQQHRAFTALHAYLFRTASYVAVVRYNVERTYAEQIAADSAQEATLAAWKNLNQLKEPGNFLAWAKLIVARVVLRKLQKEVDMDSLDAEDATEIEDNHQPLAATPEEIQDETLRAVEDAIRRCLKKQIPQQVIIENLLHNQTLKQTADLLGKKPGDVRVIKHRALEQLKKCEGMREFMNNKASRDQDQNKQSNLFHLFQALKGEQDTDLDCATVEAWLPRYVDDEMAGEDVATKYPDIKRHLDLCAKCELLYVELLELALAEQAGPLPKPAAMPAADLSFLPPLPSFVQLARQLVSTVTQKALNALAPDALPDLPALSDFFFKRADALGGLLPAQRAAALDLGEDPTAAIIVTLTAAYLTTQQIAKTFSMADLQRQIAQGTLRITLWQIAQRVAQENGMDAAAAQDFAQIYADEALHAADTWFTLIERVR